MTADKRGTIGIGRKNVLIADTSTAADKAPLIQFSADPAATAGGCVLESVTKVNGTSTRIRMSGAVAKDVDLAYKRVSRTGTATIGAGRDTCTVTTTIASNSIIACVLTHDASETAGGASVEWVKKNGTTSFTLHLSNKVENPTPFDYYVVTRTGTGTIAAGQDRAYDSDAAFTSSYDVIFVSLSSNPGDIAGGAVVEWVDVSAADMATPTDDFVIHLRDKVNTDTTYDYLIL